LALAQIGIGTNWHWHKLALAQISTNLIYFDLLIFIRKQIIIITKIGFIPVIWRKNIELISI